MSWACCTPAGECQRSHGCPAGVLCTQNPDCTDITCPGHPGKPAARNMPPKVDLRRVQLMGAAPKAKPHEPIAWLLIKRLLIGCAIAVALVAVFDNGTDAPKNAPRKVVA